MDFDTPQYSAPPAFEPPPSPDAPHLAGRSKDGRPVFIGTEGEWSASYREAVAQWNKPKI